MNNKDFSTERVGTGTYEWADKNYNIQTGCPHGCLYCYAKARALRFKVIDNHKQWTTETINGKAVNKKWRKRDGVIMFPTTHDITPSNIDACVTTLNNMLIPGNKVLIVSKPHLSCIERLCTELKPWKEQVLFRFTIGSLNKKLCSFYEPGAPTPDERINALKYAYFTGYQTSVSMEPMLSGSHHAIKTFREVEPFVTDTVWIGKMNKIRNRIDMSVFDNQQAVERIEYLQRDEAILELVRELGDEPKVRWKDSIKAVIK